MKKVRVGLLGLGKTGKVVANSLLQDKQFELVFVVKNKPAKTKEFHFVVEPKEMLEDLQKEFKPDVVVDFTTPEATMKNIKRLEKGSAIVIATTGFSGQQLGALRRMSKNMKILYAPNISDGINVLMKACSMISGLWDNTDIQIIEQHFKDKKDKPSGTALKIANAMGGDITIFSIRAGGIVGIHEVIFAKKNQKIVVRHESFGREVFAQGAKRAILWLRLQPYGFYEVSRMYLSAYKV